MNLTKLFNGPYLLQNLKKSKALITLLILLVPLFTSIILISTTGNYVFSFIELSSVNLIGMYIIPIILSIALFGYVFKKNSVDFIGSMPISRKTIFLTNTIGGILLIILTQALTMLCTLFLGNVLSAVIIFDAMVWDIFVFYTFAYIFVFTVANLAMTFSGNKISQLVSTILILFVIPFLIVTGRVFYENENGYDVISRNEVKNSITFNESYHFTAPSYFLDMIVNGVEFQYDKIVIVKMGILSILYIGIGFFLFQKKKLELAGESYETTNIHLFIKLLTLLPFMAIFCALSGSERGSVFLFFTAIIAVYYVVFDLITNKKLPLKTTVLGFLGSVAILFAYYEGIAPNVNLRKTVEVKAEEIQSVFIEDVFTYYNLKQEFNLQIDDQELIQQIVKNYYQQYRSSSSSSMGGVVYSTLVEPEVYEEVVDIEDIEALEKGIETNMVEPDAVNPETIETYFHVKLRLQLKNGREYEYTDYWNADIWKGILQRYGKEQAVQNLKEARLVVDEVELTKSEEKELLEILNQTMNQYTYEELYHIYEGENAEYIIYLYSYKDHCFKQNGYTKKLPKELYEKMIQVLNREAIDILEDVHFITVTDEVKLQKKIIAYAKENKAEQLKQYPIEEDFFYFQIGDDWYDLFSETMEKIKTFIKEDAKNAVNIEKDYIVIKSGYPYFLYYTNDIDSVCEIFLERYFEILENDVTNQYEKNWIRE